MNEITKGMHEHPFFKDFQANQVELLSKCASTTNFTAGDYIFHDGEPADRMYLIQTGKIAIVLQMTGRDPLAIMTVGTGGVVGWSWLFPPYRWHFSARVMENTSAITLDAKCIMAKCEEDYQLGYNLMSRCAYIMGERLQATRAQLLSVSAQ
jgi:CRP/FNR family transcriptional regulator, cyclic AMP receptor protein